MELKAKLFTTILILIVTINSQTLSAQSIDFNNRVEFSDGGIEDDLNSINVIGETKTERSITKEVEVVEDIDDTSLTDLAKILESKSLRYRNVRKPAEKCYRDTEETCTKD